MRSWGYIVVVNHLPSIYEALASIPNTIIYSFIHRQRLWGATDSCKAIEETRSKSGSLAPVSSPLITVLLVPTHKVQIPTSMSSLPCMNHNYLKNW